MMESENNVLLGSLREGFNDENMENNQKLLKGEREEMVRNNPGRDS